jgi:UDP-glucose 4-epimerase
MHVLVTGGLGYIGSHIVVELLCQGHSVIIIDNLYNSRESMLDYVMRLCKHICGTFLKKQLVFVRGDVRDAPLLRTLFWKPVDAVIHLAGHKAVGESSQIPLEYYDNNVGSLLTLLKVMEEHDCRRLVFSSSCTVYGNARNMVSETTPLRPCSPYGRTKLHQEDVLRDVVAASEGCEKPWYVAILRFFNPIGSHPSGMIGEFPPDSSAPPNNLMPYIEQVALKKRDVLCVFGDDYPTPDGSCIRDYVHVSDIADAHIRVIDAMAQDCTFGHADLLILNLGTGTGTSVFQLVKAFEKATGIHIPYVVTDRRPGDVSAIWAESSKFNWKPKYSIEDMCAHHFKWMQFREKQPSPKGTRQVDRGDSTKNRGKLPDYRCL